ncbi:MAG TPA: hypothetical protein VMW82_00345 [Candidatus Paceibacterota bacterium]|nr:hypothetical protein [Candidatus Paceibacterota bacterium]
MKKKFCLIGLFLFFAFFTTACYKNPDNPEPPAKKKKWWTLQLKYTRPPGSILYPDMLDRLVAADFFAATDWGNSSIVFMFLPWERIDDYHWSWSEPQSVPDNEDGPLFAMTGMDWARWDGDLNHMDMTIVGARFFVRVMETGFEKELLNVVPSTRRNITNHGPNSMMVLFRLLKNGTITDN